MPGRNQIHRKTKAILNLKHIDSLQWQIQKGVWVGVGSSSVINQQSFIMGDNSSKIDKENKTFS